MEGKYPIGQIRLKLTVFYYTVLPWPDSSVHQGFRAIRISTLTVTARNYSYLCFSDEETQAGGYVTRVRSVKKSAGWKQTSDLLRSKLVFQKDMLPNQPEMLIIERKYLWIYSSRFWSLEVRVNEIADAVETYITWKIFTLQY